MGEGAKLSDIVVSKNISKELQNAILLWSFKVRNITGFCKCKSKREKLKNKNKTPLSLASFFP